MTSWTIENFEFIPFTHPFTCMVAGPSKSGKTNLIKNILLNIDLMVRKVPDIIIFCYKKWQDHYNDIKTLKSNIQFIEGIYEIEKFDKTKNNLIIFDDLINECINDESINQLFEVDSHHQNISAFLISQNLYKKGLFMRNIRLNTNYLIIFQNPSDRSQVYVLSRQMYPNDSKFLINAYSDATKIPHGYLFLDLTQNTDEKNRVQTGILPNDLRIIYTSKKLKD
jgi:hypothetical protein